MKNWKTWQICFFTAGCVLLNAAGRELCSRLSLPLWMDSFGTVLCAYLTGPICGAMVGVTGNILRTLSDPISWAYGLTSIALAAVVGRGLKHNSLDSLLGAMTVALQATLLSVLVSVPLNMLLNNGMTGNYFGDAVFQFLTVRRLPKVLSCCIGQFYVDFLDKMLTVFALFLVLRILKLRGKSLHLPWNHPGGRGALSILLAAGLLFAFGDGEAKAIHDGYDSYVQTVYSSGNGLPCGEANDIAQTTDGILWIGTYAGVYRYNGTEFRWMDSLNSVRNANCLYVDEEGRLWIGTNDNGLAIVINEQLTNVIDQDNGLPSNSVRSIVSGADGYYYVGTTDSLVVLTLNDGLRKVCTLPEMNYTSESAADRRGNVAAVTQDGRLFLLRGGEILSSLCRTDGEVFRCCGFDRMGRLVVGTRSNRLLFYNVSGDDFALLREIRCDGLTGINDLYFPNNGDMLIAADNGVAMLDSQGSYHRINTNEFNNSIDNILMDYQGNLWFTSSRLGLLRLAEASFRDIFFTLGLEKRVVNAVAAWQGKLYFGTDEGLEVVNEACTARVRDPLSETLEGVRIRCLLRDSEDHLWICTYGQGVMETDETSAIRVYGDEEGVGNRSRVVTELSDGSIAVGTDIGISIIRSGRVEQSIGHADGLINSMILTIIELPDGTILAGTDGDGIALIRDGAIARMVTRKDGLSSEVILRAVPDPKGEGVFLVTSNGLCFLNPDASVRQLDRFPYFNNYDIRARDENTLFVISSAGLYVTNRDELLAEEGELSCMLLDARRGLSGSLTANSWTYCDADGNLFLPCDTGVFSLNVWNYGVSAAPYRLSVPKFRLDSLEFRSDRNRGIEVSEGTSRIELFPEIVNYSIQALPVGYYLEGFDTDWTYGTQASLNSIVYTNLPAGEYTLHLAVFDNELSNIQTERKFSLTKDETVYETVGFRLYFFAVILLAAVAVTSLIGMKSYASMKNKAEMGNQTIIAIAKTVDAKDQRTSQHSERVSHYAVMIAKELGWSDTDCENLRKAAKMHDIGKIGIPDSILNKPARLTDEEYRVMKSHTVQGGEILKGVTLVPHVVEGALYHHEHWDGRGYPKGLKGEEIPPFARIIGVADAFDAMTANRIYRKQLDLGYVLSELKKGSGTQFDPQAADILLRLLENGTIDLYKLFGLTPEEAGAQLRNSAPENAAEREAKARAAAEQEAENGRADEKKEGQS